MASFRAVTRPLHELIDPGWAQALDPVAAQLRQMGDFLRAEVRAGRMPAELLPIQSGVGNVANAVLAGLGTSMNPQCVVVGGELAETGDVLLGPLREAVQRRVLLNQVAPLEVVPAALGQRAEVMGALVMALRSADVPVYADDDASVGGAQDDEDTGARRDEVAGARDGRVDGRG